MLNELQWGPEVRMDRQVDKFVESWQVDIEKFASSSSAGRERTHTVATARGQGPFSQGCIDGGC